MSSNNDRIPHTVPVYTIYPGRYQRNVNYGFQYSNPETPPPKYEDVINGVAGEQRPTPQPTGPYEGPEPAGVMFVAPVYKYSKLSKTIATIFSVIFLFVFITIIGKILSVR